MLRAYQKLERISSNNGNKISFANPDYEVRNFFIHCYHLKDSLKKDSTITLKEDVEKFITVSNSSSLAADYANQFVRIHTIVRGIIRLRLPASRLKNYLKGKI